MFSHCSDIPIFDFKQENANGDVLFSFSVDETKKFLVFF